MAHEDSTLRMETDSGCADPHSGSADVLSGRVDPRSECVTFVVDVRTRVADVRSGRADVLTVVRDARNLQGHRTKLCVATHFIFIPAVGTNVPRSV